MGTSAPRLVRTGTVDLPVLEGSALASRVVGGRLRVLVTGDHSALVGVAAVEPGDGLGAWRTLDLSTLDGWPNPGADSQFEAVAADGGHLVAVMSEDSPVVLVGDTRTRSHHAPPARRPRDHPAGRAVAAAERDQLLVALDTKSVHGNGIIVERPSGGHTRWIDA